MTEENDESAARPDIDAARSGGQDAAAALLEIYRPWLLKLAEKKIDSWLRPRLAASDLVQGSIVLALDAFPDFRGKTEAELRVWMLRILDHHLIDRQREVLALKRSAKLEVPLDETRLFDNETPSQIVSKSEQASRVIEAIGKLDEELRAVVQLRYLHGFSYGCIGEELNLSRYTVNRRWLEAIDLLAKELKPTEPPS